MSLIKLFDEKNCLKINCPNLWLGTNNMIVCYGIPEECEYNVKKGYPREVKSC